MSLVINPRPNPSPQPLPQPLPEAERGVITADSAFLPPLPFQGRGRG